MRNPKASVYFPQLHASNVLWRTEDRERSTCLNGTQNCNGILALSSSDVSSGGIDFIAQSFYEMQLTT